MVGLGNPGVEFDDTRHNIGAKVIRVYGARYDVKWTSRFTHSYDAVLHGREKEALLLIPLTYMNLSGVAVKEVYRKMGDEVGSLVVVHDDLDISLGRIKIVRRGGSGGHRGVSSIIHELGTEDFFRVKIGIGRPIYGEDIEDFVLSPFYPEDKDLIKKVIDLGVEACELILKGGIELAMNKINPKNLAKEESC